MLGKPSGLPLREPIPMECGNLSNLLIVTKIPLSLG